MAERSEKNANVLHKRLRSIIYLFFELVKVSKVGVELIVRSFGTEVQSHCGNSPVGGAKYLRMRITKKGGSVGM